MKRPTMLVEAVLRQGALDLDLSVERDVATLRRRCKHEGFSFLTITLPVLSDSLERGLESGLLSCPTQFSRHGRLPRFLGGFFSRVFDKEGRLREDACPDSVFFIRQICRFMKKLKIGCTPEREAQAIAHFLNVEGELRRDVAQVMREDLVLDRVSRVLWSQVFPEIDPMTLVSRHGPGATAERRLANERYGIQYWNTRSELTFPSDLHAWPNYDLAGRFALETIKSAEGIHFLDIKDESPVRVVFVPKTQLTPRVIAIEPSHVQYMQQALKDHCYEVLQSHSLTKHSVRFTRQDVNQRLAYSSSIDKRLATLDLKDASDRVHLCLVQRIFKNSGILDYLEDSRSLHATLPDGTNVVLDKFASMGSALCFPVEAMVFYTIIQAAMHRLDGKIPSSRSIAAYSRLIDIYGDDIIVPVDYADTVVETLESYLLKVNVGKSFRFGNFRESCGADYFKGIAVNPVYARTVPHDDRRHWTAETVMSWNATADLFYLRGMWLAAQAIRDMLAQVLKRAISRTREPGSGVAHISLMFSTGLRYNAELCGWQQRRVQYTPVKTKDVIDGYESACLLKWGINVHRRTEQSVFGLDRELLSDREKVSSLLRQIANPGGSRSSHSEVDSLSCAPPDIPLTREDVERDSLPPWQAPSDVSHDVGEVCSEKSTGCLGLEVGLSGDPEPHWVRSRHPSFFDLLDREGQELDFLFSTKRGSFKSKCRWTSLLG